MPGTTYGGGDLSLGWFGAYIPYNATFFSRYGISVVHKDDNFNFYYAKNAVAISAANVITLGNRYNYIATWDYRTSPAQLALYINGVQSATGTWVPDGTPTALTGLHIGERYGDGPNSESGGLMSILYAEYVYPSALTSSQVIALYNSQKSTYGL